MNEVKKTQQHILRAMAMNYAEGHAWDRLDSEACAEAADEIASLEAECERLRQQVAALQSDANSWQSGYDKGREDGAKAAEGWKSQHARDSAELRRLCSERDELYRSAAAPTPEPASPWINGLPPVGVVVEARIPHHTRYGRQMLWTEVEVLQHAIIQGAVYSWVKETGHDGGFYAPMMLSFRPLPAAPEQPAKEQDHE